MMPEIKPEKQNNSGPNRQAEDSLRRAKDDQERIEVLKRKKEELSRSSEKAEAETKKAVEALRQAVREKTYGQKEELRDLPEQHQKEVFVESMPHLWVLPAEEVNKILQEQGARFRVDPKDWDNMDEAQRFLALENNGVKNLTKLPFIEASSGKLLEDKDSGLSVFAEADGTLAIHGVSEIEHLKPNFINKIFARAGINKKLETPKGFDKLTFLQQAKELERQGVRILFPVAGAQNGEGEGEESLNQVLGRLASAIEPRRREEPLISRVSREFGESLAESMRLQRQGASEPANPNYAEWQQAQARLRGQLEIGREARRTNDYGLVMEMVKRVRDVELLAEQIPNYKDALDQIWAEDDRVRFKNMETELDDEFNRVYLGLSETLKIRIYGELETKVNQINNGIKGGLYTQSLEHYIEEMLDPEVAKINREFPNFAELTNWRVNRDIEGIKNSQLETFLKSPSVDWRDTERNLHRVFTLMESTDFAPEQLQTTIQRAQGIVLEMAIAGLTGDERVLAEKKQRQLIEQIEAVQAMYGFYHTMQVTAMNPEQVGNVFKSFKDNTFRSYFERFTKDQDGNEIIHREDLTKEEGQQRKLNLLDEAIKVYMRRMNRERKEMNLAEGLTAVDRIDRPLRGEDFRRIEEMVLKRRLTGDERRQLETLRAYFAEKNADWSSAGSKKTAVLNWYRENKLIGSHGVDENGREMLDNRKDELKEGWNNLNGEREEGLRDVIKNLVTRDFGDEKRAEALINSPVMDQVINNAYRVVWTVAWTDYDGIRIWDPNAVTPRGDKGYVTEFAYNESSYLYAGRFLDHVWENFVDESRGKVGHTNWILQDHLVGKNGAMLPQNRTLVRFAQLLKTSGGGMGGAEYNNMVETKRDSLKNIEKLNMAEKTEAQWAGSAAVAEMIDDGDLSFEDVDWSKAFGKPDVAAQYIFGDLYSDRTTDFKMLGAGLLQKYLMTPSTKEFFNVYSYENFYSKREVRMKPWMKFAIPAHKEMGEHWKEWWGMDYNIPSAEVEDTIRSAVASNQLDIKYETDMKRRNLGWLGMGGYAPIIAIHKWFELNGMIFKEAAHPKRSWVLLPAFLLAILKGIFAQSEAQLEGK